MKSDYEDLASPIEELVTRCRGLVVEYQKDAKPLTALLEADDVHDWVHIVHLTQVAAFDASFASALRSAAKTDPLVFASVARPAWEAALQLDWIHTNEDTLGLRWFDYAFFKAALDHRGGKTRSVQESLLLSLSRPYIGDPDFNLVKQICSRHLTELQLAHATRGVSTLTEDADLDYEFDLAWYEMSESEFDESLKRSERNRASIDRLEPLIDFLRVLNREVGWRYPASWTTTSVKQMLEELYGYGTSTWRPRWETESPIVTENYRTYQKLSEVAHCSGPMVLHLFREGGGDPLAPGSQLIRWAKDVVVDALSRVISASEE